MSLESVFSRCTWKWEIVYYSEYWMCIFTVPAFCFPRRLHFSNIAHKFVSIANVDPLHLTCLLPSLATNVSTSFLNRKLLLSVTFYLFHVSKRTAATGRWNRSGHSSSRFRAAALRLRGIRSSFSRSYVVKCASEPLAGSQWLRGALFYVWARKRRP